MRRARDLDDLVGDLAAEARERLLQLGLVVDVSGQRVLDALREGLDDRFAHALEPVRDVERAERRLDERREDVPVGREPLELARRFYYDTIVHQAAALGLLVQVAGADRLLFGTDFPFEMAEVRTPAEWLSSSISDAAELAAASGGNATKLFRLDG